MFAFTNVFKSSAISWHDTPPSQDTLCLCGFVSILRSLVRFRELFPFSHLVVDKLNGTWLYTLYCLYTGLFKTGVVICALKSMRGVFDES